MYTWKKQKKTTKSLPKIHINIYSLQFNELNFIYQNKTYIVKNIDNSIYILNIQGTSECVKLYIYIYKEKWK